jgi:hypothetical protein
MADPLVSVLLPVRAPSLRLFGRALASVLGSAGVPAFEVVLVAHGGRSQLEVLTTAGPPHARLLADPRLHILEVEAEVPFAAALEVGRAACRGAFIARMDADDVMHPHRLAADVAALEARPALAAIASRVKVLPRGTKEMFGHVAWQNSVLGVEAHRRAIWLEQPVCQPAVTFRAEALAAAGGFRSGPFPEDYDLFLRLARAGLDVDKRPEVHHGWRQHDAQVTRCSPFNSRDAIAALKATHAVAHFALHGRRVVILGAGKEGRRFSRALRAVGHPGPTLFVDVDPRKQARLVHSVGVLPPSALAALKAEDPTLFAVGAVGTSGARGKVVAALVEAGFVEGQDAIAVS